jgi:hypothetical protein
MKKLFCSLVGVVAVFAVAASAQTTSGKGEGTASGAVVAGFPIPIPSVNVEIREQSDSPLRLFRVDPKLAGRLPGSPLSLRNDGTSAVAAAVIRVDGEPAGANTLIIFGRKGLAAGEPRNVAVPAHHVAREGEKVIAYVDFVLFADGRTWGADTLQRSRDAKAFVDGQNLALTRLAELTAGQDNTEVDRALNVFGASSFSEPNLPIGRERPRADFSARGYESILMILRRMPRETERGQDLARQLELAGRK